MMTVVTTTTLTRRFGTLIAVDSLTFELPAGGVVGVVGPNGSGKSTLIRMLLALIRPTSGTAQVLGAPIDRPAQFSSRVGALIESPAFVPTLSARANLTSLARLRGLPSTRVGEVLQVVGLAGRDREPVRGFSLGMKQRLGIAAALLPDPDLLLLDEPTNGLDPAGIVEIRRLLRTLSADGRTVVVSSHLLSEIEAICDHVVVIRFGELLFAGRMAELLTQTSEYIEVAAENEADSDRLAKILGAAGWNVSIDSSTARIPPPIRIAAKVSDAAAVNRTATANGLTLASLIPRQETLEDVFLRLTGHTDGALAAGRAGQSGDGEAARGVLSRLEKAFGRAS